MISIALQAAAAFNLVCNVTMVSGPPPSEERAVETFRVDLTARRFCFDDCEDTLAIASITTTEIVLQNETGTERGTPIQIIRSVNRETGEYTALLEMGGIYVRTTGSCETAPFAGFPSGRF